MNRPHTHLSLLKALTALMLLGAPVPHAATAQETPQSALYKAREELRISQITCDRISEELDRLKSSGKATPQLIKDYESYLRRVEAIRDENRAIVAQMEAATVRSAEHETPSAVGEAKPDITIPEEQGVDRLTALDRELSESLAAFDEMLLKEMERIRTASASRMTGLAREAAEAARRIEGDLEDSPASQGSGQGEEPAQGRPGESRTKDRSDETSQEESEGKPEGGVHSSGEAKKDETTRVSKTSEGGSEQDDDIVARQLREAAEREKDPELKEKLWKEYEAYKASRRKAQERAN